MKKWLFIGVLIGGLFSQATFAHANVDELLKAVAGCIREGSSPSPDEVVKCFTNAGVAADDLRQLAIAYMLMDPLGRIYDDDCYTTGQLNLARTLIDNPPSTFKKLESQISTYLAVSTCAPDPDDTLANLVPGTKELARNNRKFANILKKAFKLSFSDDQCLFVKGSKLLENKKACKNASTDAQMVMKAQDEAVVDALLTFLGNHTDIEKERCCTHAS